MAPGSGSEFFFTNLIFSKEDSHHKFFSSVQLEDKIFPAPETVATEGGGINFNGGIEKGGDALVPGQHRWSSSSFATP